MDELGLLMNKLGAVFSQRGMLRGYVNAREHLSCFHLFYLPWSHVPESLVEVLRIQLVISP